MKSLLLFIFSCFLISLASAHEHREHGAHVHGSAKLGIAFEGNAGQINFKSAGMSIIGFEHAAKSNKDVAQQKERVELFESKISELIEFTTSLNCRWEKKSVEVKLSKAGHSDFIAVYAVKCEKSPINSKINFNFNKYFSQINDLDVDFIADDLQKSAEIGKNGGSLDLTK